MFRIGLASYLILFTTMQPFLCCCLERPFSHSISSPCISTAAVIDDFTCCEHSQQQPLGGTGNPCHPVSRPTGGCPQDVMVALATLPQGSASELGRWLSFHAGIELADLMQLTRSQSISGQGLHANWPVVGLIEQFHLQHIQDLLYVLQVLRC